MLQEAYIFNFSPPEATVIRFCFYSLSSAPWTTESDRLGGGVSMFVPAGSGLQLLHGGAGEEREGLRFQHPRRPGVQDGSVRPEAGGRRAGRPQREDEGRSAPPSPRIPLKASASPFLRVGFLICRDGCTAALQSPTSVSLNCNFQPRFFLRLSLVRLHLVLLPSS